MTITANQLIVKIRALAPNASGYWVAYSGGLDSQVLLHALTAGRELLSAPLSALHINHNLQPDAPAWAEQCRAVCAELGIAYRSLSVQAHAQLVGWVKASFAVTHHSSAASMGCAALYPSYGA